MQQPDLVTVQQPDLVTVQQPDKIEGSAAARFCLNDFSRHSSVTSILNTLNLPTLQSQSYDIKLLMIY